MRSGAMPIMSVLSGRGETKRARNREQVWLPDSRSMIRRHSYLPCACPSPPRAATSGCALGSSGLKREPTVGLGT